jgi:acetylornithine deacetylase
MTSQWSEMVDQGMLIEWTQQFVRTPSPQTEQFEADPAVQAFIDGAEQLVAQNGLPHRRDSMGNLIVEVGPVSQRGVVLMAYAMTHPAGNMKSPFAGELIEAQGGMAVRGRGVSEQKGPLAAALAATLAAHRSGRLAGRLSFVLSSARETGRHDAARVALAALEGRPTTAIIAAGTSGRVSLGNKGRVDVLITVHGRSAHSSTPWCGLDAVAGAGEVIRRLGRLELGGHEHVGLGHATLVPTSIRSLPEATHTIQREVRMVWDRRLLPGDTAAGALAQIRAKLQDVAPWSVKVEAGPVMHPSEVAAHGELVSSIDRGHLSAALAAPARFYSHGSLDAGLFTEEGIEATMWGPGPMDQWHSDDEYVLASELYAGAIGYYAFIRDYLIR